MFVDIICQVRRSPATAALDLSIVLVNTVSSVSTGQLKWQNDRTGRVSWQRADLRVTGQRQRPAAKTWAVTGQPREQVLDWLLKPPFRLGNPASQANRKAGVIQILAWLETLPGDTWQDRWAASGAEDAEDWRTVPARWLKGGNPVIDDHGPEVSRLGTGMILLITGDVLRPGLPFLLTATSRHLAAEMARTRDPAGFARLESLCEAVPESAVATRAIRRITAIMAAKGGLVADITVGDCLEVLRLMSGIFQRDSDRNPYFYQLMHATGAFPAEAPPSVRISLARGQLTAGQLIDRYGIACRPVRDLLVDYLKERQPSVDYATLRNLAQRLGSVFWRDLELHNPGIDSLHLSPAVAAEWKQRALTTTARRRRDTEAVHRAGGADGSTGLLPRHRRMGAGGPGTMGAMGRSLPHPRR